ERQAARSQARCQAAQLRNQDRSKRLLLAPDGQSHRSSVGADPRFDRPLQVQQRPARRLRQPATRRTSAPCPRPHRTSLLPDRDRTGPSQPARTPPWQTVLRSLIENWARRNLNWPREPHGPFSAGTTANQRSAYGQNNHAAVRLLALRLTAQPGRG